MRRRTTAGLVAAGAVAALVLPPTATAGAAGGPAADAPKTGSTVRTVVTGLVAPLHLAAGPGHRLYLADAFDEGGKIKVADVRTGRVRQVAEITGTGGVGARGRHIWATSNLSTDEGQGPTYLVRLDRDGEVRQRVDLLAHELRENPDGQDPDQQDAQSNPYAVLPLKSRTLVADAAGNDVLSVRKDGTVRTLTVLPVITSGPCAELPNPTVADPEARGCDPVPTDLAKGRGGTVWVSGLGGLVQGRIWQIDARSGRILRTITSIEGQPLPPLTGIAVSKRGTIYASSLRVEEGGFTAGTDTVYRIKRSGDVETVRVEGVTDVTLLRKRLYAGTVVFGPSGPSGSVVHIPRAAFRD